MSVISVVGPKGGVGKSSIAVSIAADLVLRKHSVYLVDIDGTRGNGAKAWTEQRNSGEHELTKIPCMNAVGDVYDAIDALQDHYDYIVVDTGGYDSDEVRTALLATDLVVMPFIPQKWSTNSAPHLDALITTAMRYNKELRTLALMNNCSSNAQDSRTQRAKNALAKSKYCQAISPTLTNYLGAYGDVPDLGAGITELDHAKAVSEFTEIMEVIING